MYIQSPDNLNLAQLKTKIFLAGGISNCPNWQDLAVKLNRQKRSMACSLFKLSASLNQVKSQIEASK